MREVLKMRVDGKEADVAIMTGLVASLILVRCGFPVPILGYLASAPVVVYFARRRRGQEDRD